MSIFSVLVIIFFGVAILYLIVKRGKEKKEEKFEKRDN
jgi:uncharacterized membrane protein